MTTASEGVLYLYGFVGPDAPSVPADLRGVEDAPVESIDVEGFRAVCSILSSGEYGEAALSERVRDLGWVGPRGVQHERVVTWYVDHGGILPASFLTVYSSREALLAEADREGERIREGIDRVAGLHEWNLKVAYDPKAFARRLGDHDPEIARMDEEIAASTPGRRYLVQRRRESRAAEVMRRIAAELAGILLEELDPLAASMKTIPIPEGVPGSRVVLNAALLVSPEREEGVRTTVDQRSRELSDRGLDVTFSGPWAPYRFASDGAEGPSRRG